MAWNNNWNHVYPRRQYWHKNGYCAEEATVWGLKRATRDVTTVNDPCGRGSWHSRNKATGNGDAVKRIQTRLNVWMAYYRRKGYSMPAALVADGIFGAKSDGATKAVQKRAKLTVDGLVGVNTWTKIRKAPPSSGSTPV